ncbi:MAG: hypothetical protein AAF383_20750 [Cyanobacteria bacterium P01_A01_bin.83]
MKKERAEDYPKRKERVVKMKADKLEQIKVHANAMPSASFAIAKLLDAETDSEQVKTLEGIEKTVRKHLIDYVNPEVAKFLSQAAVRPKQEEKEI